VRTVTPPGGGRSCLELISVQANSMPGRFGFQGGDRIMSINGIPMKSVADAVSWGMNNSDLSAYDVLYERLGVQRHAVVHW
jgi:hypothetical protein